MIPVTPEIVLDDREIEWQFVRASGPGGQNVNKVASAVKLRFDAAASPALAAPVRARLARLAGRRMTAAGVLVIDARRYRTQERNRADAIARLVALIHEAAEPPRPRRKTRPTRASKERHLDSKRRRSRTKQTRGPVSDPD